MTIISIKRAAILNYLRLPSKQNAGAGGRTPNGPGGPGPPPHMLAEPKAVVVRNIRDQTLNPK